MVTKFENEHQPSTLLRKTHSPAGIAVLEMENVRRPDGVSPSTRTLYTPSRTPGIVKGKLFLCRLVSSVTGSNFPVVELYFSMLTMYSGPLGLNDGTSMETGPALTQAMISKSISMKKVKRMWYIAQHSRLQAMVQSHTVTAIMPLHTGQKVHVLKGKYLFSFARPDPFFS